MFKIKIKDIANQLAKKIKLNHKIFNTKEGRNRKGKQRTDITNISEILR